ncbi:MAG: TauD/TfdA family dioxygenase [Acidimicrobiales bacterium]
MPTTARKRVLTVEPIAPAMGVEVAGVDLVEVASNDDLFAEIHQLWLEHKLLVFRGQALPPAEHVRLAERFGPLESHPIQPSHADYPALLLIHRQEERTTYENVWHADATFRARPPIGAVLKCEDCPPVGGDTMWANMAMAYDRLPERIKERIGSLRAKHSIEHSFGGTMTPERRAVLAAEFPPAEHDVVLQHPDTGDPVLYVNQGFTTHFVNFQRFDRVRNGLDFTVEANHLMNYLLTQATIPEYQVRVRWRPGTVAIWDNRSTQHYAIHDYWPQPRAMSRATITAGNSD